MEFLIDEMRENEFENEKQNKNNIIRTIFIYHVSSCTDNPKCNQIKYTHYIFQMAKPKTPHSALGTRHCDKSTFG